MFMQYAKALEFNGMVIKMYNFGAFLSCLPNLFMYLEGDTEEEDDNRTDLGNLTCDPNVF
jgi:hypothetical protein